jgi:hypothetical protein
MNRRDTVGTDFDIPRIQRMTEGLTIIAEHCSETETAAEHDVLYAGNADEIPPAQMDRLDVLGWFWDDEVDCWAFFT